MAETPAAPPAVDTDFGKKCAFSGKPIKRHRRYYREGKYYISKAAFKSAQQKKQEDAAKAAPAEEPAKQ